MSAPDVAPGLYADIPIEQYHGGAGISASGLSLVADCPAEYLYVREHGWPSSAAMDLGELTHIATLEPDTLSSRAVIGPELAPYQPVERRSKADKALWQQFRDEHAGKLIVSREDWDRAMGMREAVLANRGARRLIESPGGAAELSGYWVDPHTDVLCRARPDFDAPRYGVLMNLKTDRDPSRRAFGRKCAGLRYHVAAAMNLDGWPLACEAAGRPLALPDGVVSVGKRPRELRYLFAVVRSSPPHHFAMYELDPEDLALGHRLYRRDLDTYAQCLDRGQWPGYPEAIQTLELPRWAHYAEGD